MSSIQFKNVYSAELASDITALTTVLPLKAGHGAGFPAIGTGEDKYFKVTLVNDAGQREIIKIIQRTSGSDNLVVGTLMAHQGAGNVLGRAQESTTALAVASADDHVIELRLTAAIMQDLADRLEGAEGDIDDLETVDSDARLDDIEAALSIILANYSPTGDGTADDTTPVSNAVAAAYAAGKPLYWHDGTFKTTASIPNFHDVKHHGPGVVKRGSDLFAVDPGRSNTNTLYCSTTGTTGNDGLSASEPMKPSTACSKLANYGPMLRGFWDIIMAAGTYTDTSIEIPLGLLSEFAILVRGPDVSGGVPTAIFEKQKAGDWGFRVRNGSSAVFKDLKFNNYNDGYGIAGLMGSLMATINVHTYNCEYGIESMNSRFYIGGGDIELVSGNIAGIKGVYCQLHSIGTTYDRSTGKDVEDAAGYGPNIHAASRNGKGIYLAENSTGHVTGCTFDNLNIGVEIRDSSRANFSDCNFKKNAIAVKCHLNSDFIGGSTNNWNPTGADANDRTWEFETGGVEVGGFADGFSPSMIKKTFGSDILDKTLTGKTTEHTFHIYSSFFNGHEFKSGGYIRCRIFGVITGTAGTKTFRLRLNSTMVAAIIFSAPCSDDVALEMVMHNIGSSSQVYYGWGICRNGTADSFVGNSSMTINTGSDVSLKVMGELSNAADSVEISGIEIWRGGH